MIIDANSAKEYKVSRRTTWIMVFSFCSLFWLAILACFTHYIF